MKRLALKQLRIAHDLTQEEMAAKIGVNLVRYRNIEGGTRAGTIDFWHALQQAFNIPDADMWQLQKLQEGGEL